VRIGLDRPSPGFFRSGAGHLCYPLGNPSAAVSFEGYYFLDYEPLSRPGWFFFISAADIPRETRESVILPEYSFYKRQQKPVIQFIKRSAFFLPVSFSPFVMGKFLFSYSL